MTAPFVAVIMPLSGYEPGVPGRPEPAPGWPGLPTQGLPVYPATGPVYGGGHPSHGLPWAPSYPSGQPLPPEGQPGSPTLPVKPVPPPEPGQPIAGPPPIYIVVPGYGVVGPIYLPEPAPKA